MKIFKPLFIMAAAAVIAFTAAMCAHSAYAKPHDPGMQIKPRGPGGPPVVIPDNPTQDNGGWQIKWAIFDPGPRGVVLAEPNDDKTAPRMFDTKQECEHYIENELKPKRAHMDQLAAQSHGVAGYVLFCVRFNIGERVD